jgi:hypothetical protein
VRSVAFVRRATPRPPRLLTRPRGHDSFESFPWARLVYVVVVLAVVSFIVSAITGHSLLLTGLYELAPLAVAVGLVLVIGGMQRRRR